MENIMLNGKYEKKLGVYWYKNGVQHREDGPAFVQPNGKSKWFIKGEEVTRENFKYVMEKQELMYE